MIYTDKLRRQYQNAANLNLRISIHDYSTNKTGFGNWIVSHYEIGSGFRILELGCGTGSMWKDHMHLLNNNSRLVLTDFSSGMLESCKENLGFRNELTYEVVDIQNIPYPDHSFDAVIANMMLYHVPNLDQGLSEVRRVLKPGCKFYCATYGEHGISEYVASLLHEQGIRDRLNTAFTLQNGADSLLRHFAEVRRFDYEDALEIPNAEAFANYVLSLTSLDNIANLDYSALVSMLQTRMDHGILHVPKEYGMYICR